jgi:replicative DNA helicase
MLWEQCEELRGQPTIWIDDEPMLTSKQLVNRIRLYIRRHKCELVVVDYLQLVKGQGKELRERVSEVVNAMRILAKQEHVATIVLSQLRRPGDINETPNMTWLKESGDIEASAHVVLLPHTPIDRETKRPTGEDDIIIGKQRNGPTGKVPVRFDRDRLAYLDREIEKW